MIKKNFVLQLKVLFLTLIVTNPIIYADSFRLTSNCDSNSAPILLANTLEDVASIEITISVNSKYGKDIKISKQIAPGGSQTICIPNHAKFSKIIPCLKSIHDEDTKIHYSFNKQYEGRGILASIIVGTYYPTII